MDAKTPIISSMLQIARNCWRTILRPDKPLQPFFDETWQSREIEPI